MGNENSGRNKEFENPEALWNKFLEYKEWLKANPVEKEVPTPKGPVKIKNNRIPTIQHFWCVFCEMGWASWQAYTDGKDTYTGFSEVCKRIKGYVEGVTANALVNDEGNTSGLIFTLKNNYDGWKQEENKNLKGDITNRIVIEDAQYPE